MVILVDTNVVLDFLVVRKPYFDSAKRIIQLCAEEKIKGYIAFHSLPNIYYILHRDYGNRERRKMLERVCMVLQVTGASHEKVCDAILRESFKDFEDCLQDECAKEVGADYIITRNISEFQSFRCKSGHTGRISGNSKTIKNNWNKKNTGRNISVLFVPNYGKDVGFMDFKQELAKKAEPNQGKVKLTTNMSIADLIKAMEPEIKKALPTVITPERFTRMALSAISNTPKLQECSQMSFLAALMNAAQLGLEPNTPLGQAYLIPYKNKKTLECQFQIGYKGMIDLVYRNEQVQTIQAQIVYENDYFDYELGLDARLSHRPTLQDRGEMRMVYALFKMKNGGYGFEVLSKEEVIRHAERYSSGINSSYSPWKSNFEDMAKKTAIKRVLKFAPMKADFARAIATDETIKTEIAVDMTEINGEEVVEGNAEVIDEVS